MDAITFEQFCDDNEITGRDKNNFKKYDVHSMLTSLPHLAR